MKFLVCIIFVTSGIAARADAAQEVVLDPAVCMKAPVTDNRLGQKVVGRNWPRYETYMKICPVDGWAGKPALFVYTLDLNDPNVVPYKNGKPFDMVNDVGPPDAFPLPGLIDTRQKLVGSLPIQIYASVPQSVQISFLDWRGGFPYRIAFHVVDPTAGAPFSPYCPPPLIWHSDEHTYVEAKGEFYSKSSGHP